MQLILRKKNKWFLISEAMLDDPEVCRAILKEEEHVEEPERPLAELVIRGWDLEAVA